MSNTYFIGAKIEGDYDCLNSSSLIDKGGGGSSNTTSDNTKFLPNLPNLSGKTLNCLQKKRPH